mmetsp:Transcript_10122/g.37682  ORF Transcript_10122/g.37682 Transcript_10122/m.37682 type:complete len:81 (-) Transcript_10122:1709-1951(-)
MVAFFVTAQPHPPLTFRRPINRSFFFSLILLHPFIESTFYSPSKTSPHPKKYDNNLTNQISHSQRSSSQFQVFRNYHGSY